MELMKDKLFLTSSVKVVTTEEKPQKETSSVIFPASSSSILEELSSTMICSWTWKSIPGFNSHSSLIFNPIQRRALNCEKVWESSTWKIYVTMKKKEKNSNKWLSMEKKKTTIKCFWKALSSIQDLPMLDTTIPSSPIPQLLDGSNLMIHEQLFLPHLTFNLSVLEDHGRMRNGEDLDPVQTHMFWCMKKCRRTQ